MIAFKLRKHSIVGRSICSWLNRDYLRQTFSSFLLPQLPKGKLTNWIEMLSTKMNFMRSFWFLLPKTEEKAKEKTQKNSSREVCETSRLSLSSWLFVFVCLSVGHKLYPFLFYWARHDSPANWIINWSISCPSTFWRFCFYSYSFVKN